MPRHTKDQAHQAMRRLADTSTGRLCGAWLRPSHNLIPIGSLHPEPARQLRQTLDRPFDAPVGADTPVYLVACDGTPIAWLTHHARVVTPAADLTPFQLSNQHEVAQTLASVHRWVIAALADARDQREGRPPVSLTMESLTTPRVRVAAEDDLTSTWWTPITTDHDETLAAVRNIAGVLQVRLIDTIGCGLYGRWPGPLDLAVLCALHQVADTHDLPPSVVGDWLVLAHRAESPDADTVAAGFAVAFEGSFADRHAFAEHILTRRGWRQALADVDMPERYVDHSVLLADLFGSEYRAISIATGGIAVFRR